MIFSEYKIGILEKVLTLPYSKENQWIQVKIRFPRVLEEYENQVEFPKWNI